MTRQAIVLAIHHLDDPPDDAGGSGDQHPENGGQERKPNEAKRLLIVEDDYFVSLTIEDALAGAGYVILGPVTTAEAAVALALQERPDLVLMDITLAGGGDGIEVARLLSAAGIRSLFVTAHSDPQTVSRGQAASPAGWVEKPFQAGRLVAAVRSALS